VLFGVSFNARVLFKKQIYRSGKLHLFGIVAKLTTVSRAFFQFFRSAANYFANHTPRGVENNKGPARAKIHRFPSQN
jgi:hypothetical protein